MTVAKVGPYQTINDKTSISHVLHMRIDVDYKHAWYTSSWENLVRQYSCRYVEARLIHEQTYKIAKQQFNLCAGAYCRCTVYIKF